MIVVGTELDPAGVGRAGLGRARPRSSCSAPSAGHRADHRRRAAGAGRAAATGRDPQLERALARRRWSSARAPSWSGPRIVPDDPSATEAALAAALRRATSWSSRGGVSVGRARPRAPGTRAARGRAGLLARRAAARGADLLRGRPARRGAARASACPETRSRRWSPSCSSSARRSGRCSGRRRATADDRRARQRATRRSRPRTQLVRCRLELRDDGWHAHADRTAGLARAHLDAGRRRARDPAAGRGAVPGRARGSRSSCSRSRAPTIAPMQVELRLFAMLRERAGRERLELELPEGATVADALAAARREPGLDELLAAMPVRVARQPRVRERRRRRSAPATSSP